MRIVIQCFLFVQIFSFVSCGQEKRNCNEILKQELSCLANKSSDSNRNELIDYDLAILKDCGNLDSVDQIIFSAPFIGAFIVQNTNEKVISYKMILNQITEIKKTETYRYTRQNIKLLNQGSGQPENLKSEDISDLFERFSNLDDVLSKANQTNKKVLLYFSGHTCVTARKMESKILFNDSVKSILSNEYLPFILYVDEEPKSGLEYIKLEEKFCHSSSQPNFAILNKSGELLKSISYTNEITEFIDFLR